MTHDGLYQPIEVSLSSFVWIASRPLPSVCHVHGLWKTTKVCAMGRKNNLAHALQKKTQHKPIDCHVGAWQRRIVLTFDTAIGSRSHGPSRATLLTSTDVGPAQETRSSYTTHPLWEKTHTHTHNNALGYLAQYITYRNITIVWTVN